MGRRARLDLVFEYRRGRTVLAHAYAEPPFRIGRTFDVDGALYAIVACAGPGIFAGDNLYQSVIVERGARVLLASQSSLQVHPANTPEPARVRHQYTVEDDGELHTEWDPMIPFADARVEQRFDLTLAGGSRLSWSDALMSGRCRRGESWKFRSLAHELRLRVDGTLRYLERYRLAPSERTVDRPWIAAGVDYVGTSLMYHGAATSDVAERLHDLVREVTGVQGAVDLAEPGLIVARLLSGQGAAFARARRVLRGAALDTLFEQPGLVARR